MTKVDLSKFLPDDKNALFNSDMFLGTTRQPFGIGKYSVQIMFLGMAIPSKMVGTDEEAKTMESDIWKAMGDIE